MTTRRFLAALAAALVLLAACSKSLSLDDYFTKLSSIKQAGDASQQQLQTSLQTTLQGVTDPTAAMPAFKTFIDGLLALEKDQTAKIKALSPPAEAKAAHDKLVSAFEAIVADLQKISNDFSTYTSPNDVATAIQAPSVSSDGKNLETACTDLQKVADDNKVAVDLKCSGSSSSSPTPSPAATGSPSG